MSEKLTRIAVMVSSGGTNLQALIDAQKSGVITSGKIELVISNNPDAYALTRAQTNAIPTAVCTNEEQIKSSLCEYDIDLIVLAGFMRILSADFIADFKGKIVNVHPSLIPAFCGKGFYGLKVHKAALDYGVKLTGATVHFVNEIPDGGEIIMQKAVEIFEGDTPEILQKRVMEQAEWIILPRAVEKVSSELMRGATV